MEEKIKARILDAPKMKRALQRITTEIIERNRDLNNLVIIGIRTRGVHLARRIAKFIKDMENMVIETQLKKAIKSYAVEGPHVIVAKKMQQKHLTILGNIYFCLFEISSNLKIFSKTVF